MAQKPAWRGATSEKGLCSTLHGNEITSPDQTYCMVQQRQQECLALREKSPTRSHSLRHRKMTVFKFK
jgi:hypothetical protein